MNKAKNREITMVGLGDMRDIAFNELDDDVTVDQYVLLDDMEIVGVQYFLHMIPTPVSMALQEGTGSLSGYLSIYGTGIPRHGQFGQLICSVRYATEIVVATQIAVMSGEWSKELAIMFPYDKFVKMKKDSVLYLRSSGDARIISAGAITMEVQARVFMCEA